jgi:DNA polymerase I-like protein with 3'-5' exonuclease and polymerase domains
MISLDTETTGVDVYHGAKPFFVTTCDQGKNIRFWEWDVDPLTREPEIPEEDLDEIRETIFDQELVLQNAKFDAAALRAAECVGKWPWARTHDTLVAAHLLGSNHKHDLTSLCIMYLGINIEPYELKLEDAVQKARRLCRSKLPDWRIAARDDPDMPSAKEKTWKFDAWLPRAICKYCRERAEGLILSSLKRLRKPEWWVEYAEPDHPWNFVTQEYANHDSESTAMLWPVMRAELERRSLWKIYCHKLKLNRTAANMERRGVSLNRTRLEQQREKYQCDSDERRQTCLSIAEDLNYDLQMPKGASPNNSLRQFFFDVLKVEKRYSKKSKTSNPTLDKTALEYYELTTSGEVLKFVKNLREKRSVDTAVAYMDGYERFMLPMNGRLSNTASRIPNASNWAIMHPSLNPTGTDHLRWSSSNPNEQNISKKELFNLRRIFGPAPGREWWSLDAQNLELRIPAFEAGEREVMEIFLHPERPPYFGSYHLLVFDVLHPDLFRKHGVECKTLFEATWYQWVKNGNFAIIYGCMEETADLTYHVEGAYAKIQYRFPRIAELAERYKADANRLGFVETIPDRGVDPDRGYPILCSRTMSGRVVPTVPFNYHVSGTAMQWMNGAMIEVDPYLEEVSKKIGESFITLQVHDELVLDLPAGRGSKPWLTNLGTIREVKRIMESMGDRIGVPTPVAVEYHADNWATGRKL